MENNQNNSFEINNKIPAEDNDLTKNKNAVEDDLIINTSNQSSKYNVDTYLEENQIYDQKQQNENANSDILWGAIWCIGGLIGTFANIGYVFWGAIIFGGIQLFRGLINKVQKNHYSQ